MKKATSPIIGILWAVIVMCGLVIGSLIFRMREETGKSDVEARERMAAEERVHELKQQAVVMESSVARYEQQLRERDRQVSTLESENRELKEMLAATQAKELDVSAGTMTGTETVSDPVFETVPEETAGETHEELTP